MYCTTKCMAQYVHINTYSMICEINTKSLIFKWYMIHPFLQMDGVMLSIFLLVSDLFDHTRLTNSQYLCYALSIQHKKSLCWWGCNMGSNGEREEITLKPCFPRSIWWSSFSKVRCHGEYISVSIGSPLSHKDYQLKTPEICTENLTRNISLCWCSWNQGAIGGWSGSHIWWELSSTDCTWYYINKTWHLNYLK